MNRQIALLVMIATVLVVGAMYFASNLLIPLVISMLAYLALRPTVARMCGRGVPHVLASAGVIIAIFAILAGVAAILYSPAQQWLTRAPQSIAKIRSNLGVVQRPLSIIDEAEEQISQVGEGDVEDEGSEQETVKVSVEGPSVIDQTMLLNTTGRLVALVFAIAVLSFFMLSTGDEVLNRILFVLPDEAQRHEVLQLTSEIQDSVGRYLGQITIINIGLGVVVTVVMWLIGMPTPLLWGVIATLFNFVPYIGPIGGTILVFLAAASTFDSGLRAFGSALAFWLVTAVEGQFVTPSVLGKTLKVGPLVVLVAVAFWGFIWGFAGILLAVPMLMVQRHVFAKFEVTYPLAVILGEDYCDRVTDGECEPIREDQPISEVA